MKKTEPQPYEVRLMQMLPYIDTGMTHEEIGAKVGISKKNVYSIIRRARDLGHIDPKPRRKIYSHDIKIGFLGKAIEGESQEFKQWVLKQTEKGHTLADLAMSALLDVYYDETEGEQ